MLSLRRWLRYTIIAVYAIVWTNIATAEKLLSEPLPVASNGWRPIVGTHEIKPYVTIEEQPNKQNNANRKETVSMTSNEPENEKSNESKSKNKSSVSNQLHINHHGSTGHHSKIRTAPSKYAYKPTSHGHLQHIMSSSKPVHRHPVMSKLHSHMSITKRHKSSKTAPRPNLRDEIMAPAPSSAIGSYAYFNPGPLPSLGNKYRTDFTNHFAFSNANSDLLLAQPQTYIVPKHPSQNELHSNHFTIFSDEFTRNLVPPPRSIYKPQGEKEVIKEPPKFLDQSSNINKELIRPENFVLQLPPPYQFESKPESFEIQKQNFNVYHTTTAPSYEPSTDTTKFKDFTKSVPGHGYEVTEDRDWIEQLPVYKPLYSTLAPNGGNIKLHQYSPPVIMPQDINPHFLPTPYNPETTFPTSPTQGEISTIYSELTNLSHKKNQFQSPPQPSFNIKEVATHFPIFEQKITEPTQITEQELAVTPIREQMNPANNKNQRRPNHRRRRPSRPTTTTTPTPFEPVVDNTQEIANPVLGEEFNRIIEKPQRRRRPYKQRIIESPPPTEFITTVEDITKPVRHFGIHQVPVEPSTTEFIISYTDQRYPNEHVQESTEQPIRMKNKRKRLRTTSSTTTTTEVQPETSPQSPENELDYTTVQSIAEPIDVRTVPQEIEDPTTTTTTMSPITESSTKSNRIKPRPIKYDTQQRPRFSVKDYRQRLTQYTSTSTTEPPKTSFESTKLRYPTRLKIPIPNSKEEEEQKDSTEEIERQKFVPKRKYQTTEETTDTEKYNRPLNSRLRPFGRTRTTTEASSTSSTTQKVVIKPNIFTNLKRPQHPSLRNRIYNRNRNNATTTTTTTTTSSTTTSTPTEEPETEPETEKPDTTLDTIPFVSAESKIDHTTHELEVKDQTTNNTFKTNDLQTQDVVTPDEAETFLQLQRISDLTSSAHKQYNTPGSFKSVSSASRRVPNYFTIATEDPILPIEAFFPNLNHKSNDREE